MAVYINYINQKNLFILNENYNEYLNEAFMDFNLKLSDVFDTDYIKVKLKELLFQKFPDLKNASLKIIQFILKILILVCHKMIKNISNSISNIYEGIKEIFNNISNVISKFITKAKTNIYEISLNLIASFTEDLEKEISEKMKDIKETFNINSSDIDKINQFCKLEEIQIFALETENNYLCLPFTDNDEQKIKVIKTANYYDSYFHITDQESSDILDTLIEFKEKGTRIFQKKIGNTPVFTYKIVENKSKGHDKWDGLFTHNTDIKVRELFYANKKTKYAYMYGVFVHEFIHYKDYLLNHNKFTNFNLQDDILEKLSDLKKDEIMSYDNFKKIIKEKVLDNKNADSEARYIIAILQKKKYIDYVNNNFSKIKINFLVGYSMDEEKEGQYFNSPVELNTHLSNAINEFLEEFNKFYETQKKINEGIEKVKNDLNDEYLIFNYSKVLYPNIINEEEVIKLTNTEYKIIQEYSDDFDVSEHARQFLKMIFDSIVDDDDEIKIGKKIAKSDLIKNLKFTNKQEKIKFINKFKNSTYKKIQNTFNSLKSFEEYYYEGYLLKFNKKLYSINFKNRIEENRIEENEKIERIVFDKAHEIYNEIKTRNKLKFKNFEEEKRFKEDLQKNYLKKFNEKLNSYIKNRENNKEKFNKLEIN